VEEMFSELLEPFGYLFMQRAIIVGVMVAISSSILGSFLVLKRFSMIGHGLSHVTFAAVAISLVLHTQPIVVSLPVVMLASVFILKINDYASIHGEAAIGLISSVSIAFGTVLASLNNGFNIDLNSYLFGSILTINALNMWLSIIISLLIIFVVVYFYHDLFAITYDSEYATISGIKTSRLNMILGVLTAAVIVIGTKAIGTMLISSLIVFPMVISMQYRRGFLQTILLSVLFGTLNMVVGLFTSYYFNLPSGSTIVLVSAIVFLLVYLYNMIIKR
jgi:zinc transport system permease protein